MRLPKWNGATKPSTHIFYVACFIIGIAVLTVLTLGSVRYDDRESPVPEGKVGLSAFTIACGGFVVMMFAPLLSLLVKKLG
ncbi:MAG: hypothetical protein Q7T81_13525 [Pseudolabrys sp.]|nr:hypothetical protein [Pseudolabrys sp.]